MYLTHIIVAIVMHFGMQGSNVCLYCIRIYEGALNHSSKYY